MRPRAVLLLSVTTLLAGAPPMARAAFQVQGGIGFVAVTGESAGAELVLEDRKHHEVGRGTADRLRRLLCREVVAGRGDRVGETAAGGSALPVTVLKFDDPPEASFYKGQSLAEGLQYIQARDGTLLAAMVRPPVGKHLADGPFPTVVEY